MIHVVAIITAQAGMRERMLEVFHANVPAVHAEAGCVAYEAVVDANGAASGYAQFGADIFVVVERWESMLALQAHAASPHMKAYGAKVKDWIASRAVHVLQPV